MKIVCISDTHGLHHPSELPDGDVLIHAGDHSVNGHLYEIQKSFAWLRRFPHKYKLVIGGNHDANLEKFPTAFHEQMKPYKDCSGLIYLNDGMVNINGLRFYASPVSRTYGRIKAFAKEGEELERHWKRIPDCDVLITHGPPLGFRDSIIRECTWKGQTIFGVEALGDELLRERVLKMKPKLHVFGHIHSGHGIAKTEHTTFVNAAMLNEAYNPAYEPIVVEL